MIGVFSKTWKLLDRKERKDSIGLFLLILCMGLLEAIGVASIMPFISVMANPSIISENHLLRGIYDRFGFNDVGQFGVFLGGSVFILVVGSLVFKAFTYSSIVRYTQMRNYSLSCRLLQRYLGRSYSWFLTRHSADLGKAIIIEVLQVVNNALIPAVNLVANTVVAGFLLLLIVIVNPAVAITASAIIGGAYLVVYLAVRKRLAVIGVQRGISNQERVRIAQEALSGIKDIKVRGIEGVYISAFEKPALKFSISQAQNLIIGQLPRFLLEALVFGGMIVLILVLIVQRQVSLAEMMPIFALYAVAGARLIPAFQQVYQALARLRYGRSALNELYDDMSDDLGNVEFGSGHESLEPKMGQIRLREGLTVSDVQYRYPNSAKATLNKVNLSIKAKSIVALVGASGAGKTTVVDILLGLLMPQQGGLFIDGVKIDDKNVSAWQRSIGYVPQHIFLTDESIARNIAFGDSDENIKMQDVVRSARIAGLHDFIVHSAPDGYDTKIGERGVRLSGGQRQRIGIARALYRDPDVLVLDEATSALDNRTERSVMTAINTLGNSKTIIVIAHRLSTIRNCQKIYLLDEGRVKASGTYSELLQDPAFNSLVKASDD